MLAFLLAAILPGILWRYDIDTVEQVRSAGDVRIYVPDVSLAPWRERGIGAQPASKTDSYARVPAPALQMRPDIASATAVPWIDANGWRFLRGLQQVVYTDVPTGRGAIASAEAFAYGVDAVIEASREDLPAISAMLHFLRRMDAPRMPALANIGVVHDGSTELDEVLNLLGRRNLLYRVVQRPDPSLDLNVRLGSAQYPRDSAHDPNDFAARVREQLTDDKRLVRLFGSYTVLAHLTGDSGRARLHLLNYSKQPVRDLRVRVRGSFRRVFLHESSNDAAQATDLAIDPSATELTIPLLTTYAVVDLQR